MKDFNDFLEKCVFYPCSRFSGAPVKFLGNCFQHYFYVDYSKTRAQFNESIKSGGFKGYRLVSADDLTPEVVLGMSWEQVKQEYDSTISKITLKWSEPFIVFCRFERTPEYAEDPGPDSFELMFAGSEAISTFISVFSRRNLAPKCLVHIRSGMGLGGNFSEYPKELAKALRENKGGLPRFILHDDMGFDPVTGDYLDLINQYKPIQKNDEMFCDQLTLSELNI